MPNIKTTECRGVISSKIDEKIVKEDVLVNQEKVGGHVLQQQKIATP